MSEEKRAVRVAKAPEPDGLDRQWAPVIRGIVTIDVEAEHAELESRLAEGDPRGGSALVEAINHVQRLTYKAAKLKNYTRSRYELYKEEHEKWVGERQDAALATLEQEKKDNKLAKQITIDMIKRAARATWSKEFAEHERRLREFQAADHTITELYETWKSRARSLSDLKDLALSMGVGAGSSGSYRARSRDDV